MASYCQSRRDRGKEYIILSASALSLGQESGELEAQQWIPSTLFVCPSLYSWY